MFHHLRDETGEGVNTRIRGRHKYLPSVQVFTVIIGKSIIFCFSVPIPTFSTREILSKCEHTMANHFILHSTFWVYIQTYGEMSMYCARVLYIYALRGMDTRHLALYFLKVLVRGILLKYLRKILFTFHTVVSLYHFFTNNKICDDLMDT